MQAEHLTARRAGAEKKKNLLPQIYADRRRSGRAGTYQGLTRLILDRKAKSTNETRSSGKVSKFLFYVAPLKLPEDLRRMEDALSRAHYGTTTQPLLPPVASG